MKCLHVVKFLEERTASDFTVAELVLVDAKLI